MANFYTGGLVSGNNLNLLNHKESIIPLREVDRLKELALKASKNAIHLGVTEKELENAIKFLKH